MNTYISFVIKLLCRPLWRKIHSKKIRLCVSDYDFMKTNVRYVCGMSVPPLMTKSIAEAIKKTVV
ncbi:MAG: hypothetical protein KGV44_14115 [Flavobacteriaceae bacterium]|nr:hypothetical protein [Flavobacteriaceae bacterium]